MLCFFFFNDTATTEIYTLSLHDALPICNVGYVAATGCRRAGIHRLPPSESLARILQAIAGIAQPDRRWCLRAASRDRKSTRLNSSHSQISYAVFCLKKKRTRTTTTYLIS